MIIFEGVTYGIGAGAKMRKILAGTEVTIPSDRRIAVLANDADERRVFMELLGGLLMPQSGRLIRKARVSFPAGYVGGFKADLSLRSNVAGGFVDSEHAVRDNPFRRRPVASRRPRIEILSVEQNDGVGRRIRVRAPGSHDCRDGLPNLGVGGLWLRRHGSLSDGGRGDDNECRQHGERRHGELGSVDRCVEIDFESIPEHNELGWTSPKAGLVASQPSG